MVSLANFSVFSDPDGRPLASCDFVPGHVVCWSAYYMIKGIDVHIGREEVHNFPFAEAIGK